MFKFICTFIILVGPGYALGSPKEDTACAKLLAKNSSPLAPELLLAVNEYARATVDLEDAQMNGTMSKPAQIALQIELNKKRGALIKELGEEKFNESLAQAALENNQNHEIIQTRTNVEEKSLREEEEKQYDIWGLANTLTDEDAFRVDHAEFSPDGKLALSCGEYTPVSVWDLSTGKVLFKFGENENEEANIQLCKFSPDGKYIATVSTVGDFGHMSRDYLIFLWDAKTGRKIRQVARQNNVIPFITFSPDSKKLATVSVLKNAVIYDIETNKKIVTLKGHQQAISKAVFNSDGTLLATASEDETIRVWNIAEAKTIGTIGEVPPPDPLLTRAWAEGGNWFTSLGFHPNGKTLITGSAGGEVEFWSMKSFKLLKKINIESYVNDVIISTEFSADQTRFVTASARGDVKIWNAKTRKELFSIPNRTKPGHWVQNSVQFGPDGRSLIIGRTGHDSAEIAIWKYITNQVQP